MKQIALKTTQRTEIGGNTAKRHRREGQVPAVIYGESGEKHLLIDAKDLAVTLKAISGKAVLIEMSFADGTEPRYAMLKEVSRNPVTDKPLHVDFIEVVRGKPMLATLPIRFFGESHGVKNENGIIDIHEHEVRVKCRPRDLPEMISIDISPLKVGEAFHLRDIKAPEGVEFVSPADALLVSCSKIVVKEEEAPAAADAAPAAGAAAPAADAKKAEAKK